MRGPARRRADDTRESSAPFTTNHVCSGGSTSDAWTAEQPGENVMTTAGAGPNPESFLRTTTGREVQIKAHRALWSGAHPANSMPALEECYREAVARAEVDLHMLDDADFLVLHDHQVDGSTTGTGAVGELTRREAQVLRVQAG